MTDTHNLPDDLHEEVLSLLIRPEAERQAALATLCEQHAEHAQQIQEWFATILGARREEDLDAAGRVTPGDTVGPYKILDVLGEGGMGTVYLAEQKKPVRRRVALKVIKLGMDTKAVLARFDAERQALAMMEHSSIARVYDCGTTEQGQPYFAMEYVKGPPIAKYCDDNRLDIAARLQLFVQICSGVQHAHNKGVIHRDLTPNNVLVTTQDGQPRVKIIDFGLARATDHRLVEATIYTEQGQVIGTPAYMSPEQAGLRDLDIDTRTDVYTLGVLLYELLVGEVPFSSNELRKQGLLEMQRRIREDDPPKPSTKLTTHSGTSSDVARLRRTDTSELRRRLKTELDWVVLKALEKDRTRRYETVSEFAADIRRHLAHEAVLATPPTASYRLRKFLRKHRGPVGAVAAVFSVLLVALIVVVVLAQQTRDAFALADHRLQRITQLSRSTQLERAKRLAETFWPVTPAMVDGLRRWIVDHGIPLREQLPAHERALTELRTMALDERDGEQSREPTEQAAQRLDLEKRLARLGERDASPLQGKVIEPHGFFLIAERGVVSVEGHRDLLSMLDLPTQEGGGLEGVISLELVLDGVHMDYVLYGCPDEPQFGANPEGDVPFDGVSFPRSEVIWNTHDPNNFREGVVARRTARDLYAGHDVLGFYSDEDALPRDNPNGVWWSLHEVGDPVINYIARSSRTDPVPPPAATPPRDGSVLQTGDVIIAGFQTWNTRGQESEFVELFNVTDRPISLERVELIARVDKHDDGSMNIDSRLRDELPVLDERSAQKLEASLRWQLAELGPVRADREWRFADDDLQWEHDTQMKLVSALRRFLDPDPRKGTLASIESRLELASTMAERSMDGDDAGSAWSRALADIAQLDVYRSVELTPQLGLVPLRRDPRSGLWEFWDIQSGDRPRLNLDPNAVNPWLLTPDTGLIFVLVPGGTFRMGAQDAKPGPNYYENAKAYMGPPHEVSIAPFFISRFEMTQRQWRNFTGMNPSYVGDDDTLLHPVDAVSWYDCQRLAQRMGFALPTEAQWECAAWAGTDPPEVRGHVGEDGTAPIGLYPPNPFGLHDMIGNVWEWTLDAYAMYDLPVEPGTGERLGNPRYRVYRGASFEWGYSHPADRQFDKPENIDWDIGFRPARAVQR